MHMILVIELYSNPFQSLKGVLEEKGEGGRSWLGSYTNTDLAMWTQIIDAYEKNNIWMGEMATAITQVISTMYCISIKNVINHVDLNVSRGLSEHHI